MKNVKRIFLISIIIANIFVISGCWNYREVNEINIIHGAAIDKKDDKYILTTEIIKPMGGQNMKIEAVVLSGEGLSIIDAARNIIGKSGKKGYWSHAKVWIISEEIAKEGVVQILDFLNRDAEARSDIWLLVSKDKTAKQIFIGKDKIHSTMSSHLEDVLKNEKSLSKFETVELSKFVDDLAASGVTAVLPMVYMTRGVDDVIPAVYGCAVFKKDKMVGQINGIQTKFMLLIKNKLKGGILPITNIDEKETNVSLEVFKAKTKLKPIIKDKNITIKIDSKIDVGIAEINTDIDYISKSGREKLKKYAEKVIKNRMEEVIKKAQKEYDSDIFGFGSLIYRENPKKWKEMEKEWDQIFENIDTQISVKLNIKGSALLSKPIKVGD